MERLGLQKMCKEEIDNALGSQTFEKCITAIECCLKIRQGYMEGSLEDCKLDERIMKKLEYLASLPASTSEAEAVRRLQKLSPLHKQFFKPNSESGFAKGEIAWDSLEKATDKELGVIAPLKDSASEVCHGSHSIRKEPRS